MASTSTPDPDEQPDPWYRSPAVISIAGVSGVALIAALVFTVVRMSDQWSSPSTPTVMTSNVPTTQQTLRTTEPFIATPSYESSTFPTSVDLSTTDIGVPDEVTSTTESSETSSGESTTTTPSSRTSRPRDDDETTTTRKRPRLNETRTLSP